MDHNEHKTPIEAGHEPSVFHARAAVVGLIGMAVLTVFGFSVTWGFFEFLGGHTSPQPAADTSESVDIPVARTLPPLDARQKQQRLKYEAEQKELLRTYGWFDAQKTVARIPIERAMELTVKQYGENP